MEFVVFEDNGGRYHWRIVAGEGRADASTQMGHQAEGPEWRNIYLTPLSLLGRHASPSVAKRRCASSTSLTICQ